MGWHEELSEIRIPSDRIETAAARLNQLPGCLTPLIGGAHPML